MPRTPPARQVYLPAEDCMYRADYDGYTLDLYRWDKVWELVWSRKVSPVTDELGPRVIIAHLPIKYIPPLLSHKDEQVRGWARERLSKGR